MDRRPEELYLDLLKKTLSYSLWPEPPLSIDTFDYARPFWKRWMLSLISRVIGWRSLQLVKLQGLTAEQRAEGRGRPAYADTMIGLKRLDHLQLCIETVLRDGIEGDFIETGVWRGGACIFMRALLAVHAVADRKVYVADSFEGLPAPDPVAFPADRGDRHHVQRFLAVSEDEVRDNFRKYGMLDSQVIFLKGWFKDTLAVAPIEKLAILRLDGDMYGSTMEALTHLYPKLSVGGFCIVDDYALPACRSAVEDFMRDRNIRTVIERVDWMGAYWRKE